MQRVVFHHEAGPALRGRLAALGEQGLQVSVAPDDPEGMRTAMADAEILWHVLIPATAAIIEAAPRLRLIQKIGVGVNTIDLEAAAARGIAVCNMPGTNTAAVAEMTLALMLACLRRLPQLDSATRAGRGWALPAEEQDRYGELGGRIVGLVGMGAVPRRLAPVLDTLGAEVVYANRTEHPELPWRQLPLDRLLGAADIVSLHLPLVPETDRHDRRGGPGPDAARGHPDQHGARRPRRRAGARRRTGNRQARRSRPRCLRRGARR